jgi:hypothetical protein
MRRGKKIICVRRELLFFKKKKDKNKNKNERSKFLGKLIKTHLLLAFLRRNDSSNETFKLSPKDLH